MKIERKKKVILSISGILIVIVLVGYSLANRYLIPKVQATVTEESMISKIELSNNSANAETSSSEVNDLNEQNTVNETLINDNETLTEVGQQVFYDAMNYESDNIQVHITKVEKGSGDDKITYYVADVKVSDSSYLKTAFANNQVGQNIIEDTSEIANAHNAILAINGDYYGFRSDGVLIRNGIIYRDNGTRTGLYFDANGSMKAYDETEVSAESLLALGVEDTFSFGPVLIDDGVVQSGFDQFAVDTNMGNRSIDGSNPRTGIGYISDNHYVFIVVDGRKEGYSKGVTLDEFAEIFAEYDCSEAYNLDGGGSSTMVFMGNVINNPLGKGNERGVSDILYVGEEAIK